MSDQIPFHIQEEIIKKLPVKSLVQFRCVSKTWKSLIDSSEFIAAHSVTQPHHLFLTYRNREAAGTYVSFVDDDTFPQQRSVLTLPLSVQLLMHASIVGTSHGLLCFHGYSINLETEMTVLWNPSIRKSISVAALNSYEYNLGFGVCPVTKDPKIVAITRLTETSDCCEAKVYALSSSKWRNISCNLSTSIQGKGSQVVIDGFIYRCALNKMFIDGEIKWTHNLIMSFDITNEDFGVIDLPDSLIHHFPFQLSISKSRDSLLMLKYNTIEQNVCDIWIMENGVQKSFTKLFTIKPPYESINILGFRKGDQPILESETDDEFVHEQSKVSVYDPNSKHINDLEIRGITCSFCVDSYMETLVLLNRYDCSSY